MNAKKMLLAVDASENATRAVDYVTRILNGSQGFEVTVLYIERPPNRDFFATEEEWLAASQSQEQKIREFMDEARATLLTSGLPADKVQLDYIPSCQSGMKQAAEFCSLGTSIARDILTYQQGGGFGTLVIGRRGISRAEEFLFGSVTTKVTHLAKNCTIWVVQ